MSRIGGRPRQIVESDIVAAGRSLGMDQLSVKAVAAALQVTPTALYRHVDGRWGLERLVGESLLDELTLRDDPAQDTATHLLSFGIQLRDYVAARPGLAGYLQVLFPRGEGGRRLLSEEVAALGRRGYQPPAAIVLSGAVASTAINLSVAQERRRDADLDGGYDRAVGDALDLIHADEQLRPSYATLPDLGEDQFGRMMLAAAIRGFVAVAPPGRPVDEILAELAAAGAGL